MHAIQTSPKALTSKSGKKHGNSEHAKRNYDEALKTTHTYIFIDVYPWAVKAIKIQSSTFKPLATGVKISVSLFQDQK